MVVLKGNMTQARAVLVTLGISLACLAGDYYLKRASQLAQPFRSIEFVLGIVIFAATAAGWVIVLRVLKLGTIGVIYGVATVIFMTLLGWLGFGESLRWHEWAGIILGIISILLLTRFA